MNEHMLGSNKCADAHKEPERCLGLAETLCAKPEKQHSLGETQLTAQHLQHTRVHTHTSFICTLWEPPQTTTENNLGIALSPTQVPKLGMLAHVMRM